MTTKEYTTEDRAGIEKAFDHIETWLSTAPTGYEFHEDDGTVTTVNDAWKSLRLLRLLLLGEDR